MNSPFSHESHQPPLPQETQLLLARLNLVDRFGATDVRGPMRVAGQGEHELYINGARLLLLNQADYESYQEHFSAAGLEMLESSDEYDDIPDVAVVEIPTDTIGVDKVITSHPLRTQILGDVFFKMGSMVRRLADSTGQIPSARDLGLSKVVTMRRQGVVTLVPPVEFVDADDQNMVEASRLVEKALSAMRADAAAGQYVARFTEGLKGDEQQING